MKIDSTKTTNTKELKNEDKKNVSEECLVPCDMSFKEMIMQPNNFSSSDASLGLKDSIIGFGDFKTAFNYDSFTIDRDDAMFFVNIIQNGQYTVNPNGNVNGFLTQLEEVGDVKSYKSINTSKTLANLIESSYNTQKPVRIDFDNNVSVILKIDKEGKVKAEFIPGDKAVETYLRDNIPYLKQKFDEQNLPYTELSYRQSKQQNKKKEKGE